MKGGKEVRGTKAKQPKLLVFHDGCSGFEVNGFEVLENHGLSELEVCGDLKTFCQPRESQKRA